MEFIDQDYEPASGNDEFEQIDDGPYQVEEVSLMSKSIDEKTQRPILVEGNYGMQLFLTFRQAGGEAEVPVSCDLGQLPYVVKAFGGDLETLPQPPQLADVKAVEDYILLALELTNSGAKRPNIEVKKGWGSIGRLSGAQLPADTYHFTIKDFTPKENHVPFHEENTRFGGRQFNIILNILADNYGEPSPFTGSTYFWAFVGYKVEAIPFDGDFKVDWIRGKDGRLTPTSKAFALFLQTIAPSLFPNPEFSNPHNILPEVLDAALNDKIVFRAEVTQNDKGFTTIKPVSVKSVDPSKLKGLDGVYTPKEKLPDDESPLFADEEEPEIKENYIPVMFARIMNVLGGDKVFPITGKFSPKLNQPQQALVKKYLAPNKTKFSSGKPDEWTEADLTALLEVVPYGELEQEAVEALSEISNEIGGSGDLF